MPRPLVAYALALVAASAFHLRTGLGDQGDYGRSVGFLLDHPVALADGVPAQGTPERARFLREHWHDRWVVGEDAPRLAWVKGPSTYKVLLAAQVGLDALVTRDRAYSFVLGSLLTRALFLGGVVALVARAARRLSAGAAAALALLLAAIALETTFVAFLNSAYEDQLAIVLLPWLALLVWRAGDDPPSGRAAHGALAVAAIVGASKPQLFYLPLLVAPFVWSRLRLRGSRRRVAAAVGLAAVLAAAPIPFTPWRAINAYHALYKGILRELPPERLAAVRPAGRPVLPECLGVGAWSPTGPACLEAAGPVGLGDTAAIALRHPGAALRLAQSGLSLAWDLELRYLGKAAWDAERGAPAPTFADAAPFGVWRRLHRTLGGGVLLLTLVATATASLLARRSPLHRAALLLALLGVSQHAAAFADGLTEYPKHVLAGAYANALSLSLGVAALAWAAARYIESRLKTRSGMLRTTSMMSRQNEGT